MNDFQSALDPAGPQAGAIAALWWTLFVVASLVWLAVVAALVRGTVRAARRARESDAAFAALAPDQERRTGRVIAVAVGATAVVLLFFLVVSVRTGRAITRSPDPAGELVVEVNARQWWWNIEYVDPVPSRRLRTANELVVPVGRPVRIRLTSSDVIHSFWVPNLTGKRDLVPGRPSTTWFRADTAGAWRGQCAEFCGHQHAKMAFWVVAVPDTAFNRWYASQLQPAPEPADSQIARGREVFLTSSCVMCHAIQGTPAGSRVGPDLTHVASRRSLAAGALPNVRGHLAGWILDPQRQKPGVRMPPNALEPRDLDALLRYLETLR